MAIPSTTPQGFAPAQEPQEFERAVDRSLLPWAILAALIVVAAAELMYLGRGLTFNYDEWEYVLFRQGHALDVFLKPHNEHVSVIPIVVFKGLFSTVGIEHYGAYRLTNVLVVQACAVLVYLYGRPRIGAWYALVPAALVGFMGAATEDLFWPFEMSLEIPIACVIGGFLLLDRGGRWADVAVSALATVAAFCSGVGLAVLAALAVDIGGRPGRARRAWVVVVPAALYLAWWIPYRADVSIGQNIPFVPRFNVNSLAASARGLLALDAQWGPLLVVAVVGGVALTIGRGRGPNLRLVAVCVMAIGYWTSIALVRGADGNPDQGRYLFVGGTVVALAVVEMLRGRRLPEGRTAASITAVVTAGVCLASLQLMRDFLPYLRDPSRLTRAELGAVELARDTLPPELPLTQGRVPGGTVGLYLRARDAYGSAGGSEAELARAAPDARKVVDYYLVRGAALGLERSTGPLAVGGVLPSLAGSQRTALRRHRACTRVAPSAPGAGAQVAVPPGGIVVRPGTGTVSVGIRRFSDEFTALGAVSGPQQARLRLRSDRARRPWIAQAQGTTTFAICAAAS